MKMDNRFNHPKIFHLPWSLGITADGKVIESLSLFEGYDILITEKRKGECTSLYADGFIHSKGDSYLSSLNMMWKTRNHLLPKDWRVVGENLIRCRSIKYDNLESYFEVFAIFDDNNVALSWEDTVEWCYLLGLRTVPLLWYGLWNEYFLRNFHCTLDLKKQEGYVVRAPEEICYEDWDTCVSKWVRPNQQQIDFLSI